MHGPWLRHVMLIAAAGLENRDQSGCVLCCGLRQTGARLAKAQTTVHAMVMTGHRTATPPLLPEFVLSLCILPYMMSSALLAAAHQLVTNDDVPHACWYRSPAGWLYYGVCMPDVFG